MQSEPKTQAFRIAARFGGFPALHRALVALGDERNRRRSISCIYRWNLPRSTGGTGGVVPTRNMPDIIQAARAEGISLTPDDMDPRAR